MKKLIIIAVIAFTCCKKKEVVTPIPNDPFTGLPANAYEFYVSGYTDTAMFTINGKPAEVTKFGNYKTYILNSGDIFGNDIEFGTRLSGR